MGERVALQVGGTLVLSLDVIFVYEFFIVVKNHTGAVLCSQEFR